MRLPQGLAAFRHRNFRLFWSGMLVSLIGTWMQQVGQAWLVLQMTNDPLALGVIAMAQFGPILVLGPLGGIVADSVSKRTALMFTQTAAGLLAIILAALFVTGHIEVWHIFVLAVGLGIVNSFDMPIRQAFVIEMVGREDIANAVALNSTVFNLTRIVGPAIAGLTIAGVGIAPLFSRPRTFGGLMSHQSTEFLGTGVVGSDYLDLIVRRGEEGMVRVGLTEYLNREKPLLTLSHLPARSAEADGLVKELELSGWQAKRRIIESCPYITLRGHTWESYLDSLGANHRYNFMRRLKNLQKAGVVEFDAVEKEDQRRDALQAFMTLHAVAWHERGGSQAMQTTRELAFHEAFSRTALDRGWLRLFLLRVNGRPVGALYGFRRGPRFYFYQSGFDPAWRKHSVGLVTMGLAIKQALAEGVEEYDLLHGTEAYKFRWAKETRDLSRVHLFPPSWRGWLYRASLEAESQGKQAARRWLPQTMLDRLMKHRRGA